METWLKINDFPNYSISNFGNVRNDIKNTFIKGGIRNGYRIVVLSNKGLEKTFKIHRLVSFYFLDNFDDKLDIDHIDRNKLNNNISNLRCVSRSDNLRNRNKKQGCSSIYKGVQLLKNGKWRGSGYLNKKVFNLGHFDTEEEAVNSVSKFNAENNITIF